MSISLGLSNYYGSVEAIESNGKYFIELEDWGSTDRNEISKEFYEAIKKEFGEE